MTRKSYIQIDGKLYDKDGPLPEDFTVRATSATVMGDLPDFVSPIDRTVISGRAGMREHCKKYNVVPTADLAGLPPKPNVQQYVPDRAAIRELVQRQVYQ